MTTNMENFKNLYEVRKTVRFKLEPKSERSSKLGPDTYNDLPASESTSIFIDLLDELCTQLTSAVFTVHKDGSKRLTSAVDVKYQWLRTYTRNDFYNFTEKHGKSRSKKYALYEVSYLIPVIESWSCEWVEIVTGMRDIQDRNLHEQRRRSEFSRQLNALKQRRIFEFIREFIYALNAKKEDEVLDKTRKVLEKIEELLPAIEKHYLPSQSGGIQIAKGTFNYYTLNKDRKLRGQKAEENDANFLARLKNQLLLPCPISLSEIQPYFSDEDVSSWSLEDAYRRIKKYKSDTKQKFIEAVQKGEVTVMNLRANFPLFDAQANNFKNFAVQTSEIGTLAESIKNENDPTRKQSLQKQMHTLKQRRSHFFNDPNNRDRNNRLVIITENYKKYCDVFKSVAREFGNLRARIHAVESEVKESQQLGYWSVILEQNGVRSLLMFPRRTVKEAREKILSFEHQTSGNITVHTFNSLTFRALWKLCFKKEGNTFFFPVAKELRLPFEHTSIKGLQHKHAPYFYQRVLKSESAKQQLNLVDFGGLEKYVLRTTFNSVSEFESALERYCYTKKTIYVTEHQKMELIAEFDAFEYDISSQDIVIKQRELPPSTTNHSYKKHSQLWFSFWSEFNAGKGYITRINPEVRIFWREALSDKGTHNRYSRDQFTLATTITENATSKKSDFAFKEIREIQEHLQSFSKEFNKNFSCAWNYGIDRGTKELATLCVMQPTLETVTVNGRTYKKPKFAVEEALLIKDIRSTGRVTLKDGNEREQLVISNPSYFVGKAEYGHLFVIKTIPCVFDMSAAKLINGHIVLNGDLVTYLKLKECSARRRLNTLFRAGKISSESLIIEKNDKLWVTASDREVEVYWKTAHDDGTYMRKAKAALQTATSSLSIESLSDEIEEINRLRNSITANIIGIIAYLHTKYPGVISLENFSQHEHYDKHAAQSEENISRQLEWMLYRKFQTEGSVPPGIRQPMLLREELKHERFGLVTFVETQLTSRRCPRCQQEKEAKTNDCKVCCFSYGNGKDAARIGFEALDNSDKGAAYNIAKRGLEFFEKQKKE